LNGSDIVKGELQIKLSNYNRGNLIKVTTNAVRPYFVEQLGDALNYITMTLSVLDSTNEPYTKQSATEMLETGLKYITSSRNALTRVHAERIFPYKICDPQMFNSEMPEDLVIEFYVEGPHMVTSIYAIQYHTSATPPKLGQLSGILGSSKQPAKVCKYKDNYATILDEISVKSLDPRLEEVVEGLRKTESICLGWANKLALF